MDLQAAIHAAPDGAVVIVPAGRHAVNLVIDKSVTLRAQRSGAAVLDGGRRGPVVAVAGGAEVTLHGLTVENGAGQMGGGIDFRSERLLLVECVVQGNIASAFGGGGIYTAGRSLRLERCRLLDNQGRLGGALLADGLARVEIEVALVADNQARRGGGLALREGAEIVLEGVTLADNVALDGPGAELALRGTSTRTPKLRLTNTIVAGDATAVVNEGGEILASHSLLPIALDGVQRGVLAGPPGFRRPGKNRWALRVDSPAVGAGDASHVVAGALDLVGAARRRRGLLDLGAFALDANAPR